MASATTRYATTVMLLSFLVFGVCPAGDFCPGWSARVYTDPEGGKHGYVLFVPFAAQKDQDMPVLLFLNGNGQNGGDGVNQVRNQIGIQALEMREFFPFLVVAPQCRAGSSWSGNTDDAKWAIGILDEIIEEFDANPDRLYLTGVSAGGAGAWNIAGEHFDRFAAIAPLCGNGGNLDKIAEYRIPVWNFVNDEDAVSLVEESRRARRRLIQLGESPLFTEFHKRGHNCWNAAYRMPALYGWLLEQRRSHNSKATLFEYLDPNTLLSLWSQQGDSLWSTSEEETLVAKREGGRSVPRESFLVSSLCAASQELHADIWIEDGNGFTLALIPESDIHSEIHIVGLIPEAGAGGIVQTETHSCLGGLSLAAEQSLRPKWWNDVRVRLHDGRLTVRLNGWPAADVLLEQSAASAYRFALVMPSESNESRWRYVRTRELK